MNNLRMLHEMAMKYAEKAGVAKRSGDRDCAFRLYRLAFEHEFQAAYSATKEPARSILLRSAALELAHDPPNPIASELRDILERANAEAHTVVVDMNPIPSIVRELHNQAAMELAQLAVIARHNEDEHNAVQLAQRAYMLERQAAEQVSTVEASEPTRAILYRSAASLAYQAREFSVAQELIAEGLSGFPPLQVESELYALHVQVLQTLLSLRRTMNARPRRRILRIYKMNWAAQQRKHKHSQETTKGQAVDERK